MKKQPRSVDQRVRYNLIRDALPSPPARVCEIGVGGAWLLHCLHEEGYDVHGCDVSHQHLPPNSPIAEKILLTSGVRLPFPDNFFDATYSCDVLEHVLPEERSAFLAEHVRVTKPGGVVALTAFFNNTLTFRLLGAWLLLTRRTLPSWYIEHLVIPLPNAETTTTFFQERLTNLRVLRYQRFLNLSALIWQSLAPRRHTLQKLWDLPTSLVPACDVLGKTTSVFFAGTKANE